jgi:hypothetical protein
VSGHWLAGRPAIIAVSVIAGLVLTTPWAFASSAQPIDLNATLTPATWNKNAGGTGSGTAVVEINAERTLMTYRITYVGAGADITEALFCAGVGTTLEPGASIPPDSPDYCAIVASTWKGGPSPITGSGPINYTKELAPDAQAVLALASGTAYVRLVSRNGPELEGRLLLAAPQTDVDPATNANTANGWTPIIPVLAGFLAFAVLIRSGSRRRT